MPAALTREAGAAARRSRRPLGALLLLVSACSAWQAAVPPEWSARERSARPGVIEIEADRDHDGSFAKVLTPDGREEVVRCESVPCRAVVSPGRYRVVVGTGGTPWVEAYGAAVEVEVAPCVTERILVALAFKLARGDGRVRRHERVWLASDPHRVAPAPAGCPADSGAPPPAAAPPPPR